MDAYDDDYDGDANTEQATQEADDVDEDLAAAIDEDYDDDDDDPLAASTAPNVPAPTFIGSQQDAGDDDGAADEDGAGDGDGDGDDEQMITGIKSPGRKVGYADDDVDVEPDELVDQDEGDQDAQPEDSAAATEADSVADMPVNTEAERQKKLLMSMTEEQLDRYEAYRRSALPRPKIRKLVKSVSLEPTNEAVIAMGAIGKLFVGEMIELARKVATQQGHSGALTTKHIHTAYQLLNAKQKVPQPVGPRRMFKRCGW